MGGAPCVIFAYWQCTKKWPIRVRKCTFWVRKCTFWVRKCTFWVPRYFPFPGGPDQVPRPVRPKRQNGPPCPNSIPSLQELMRKRFSPKVYCRPTAAPSSGQVDIAMAELGDFKNTLMTLSAAIKKYGATPFCVQEEGATSEEGSMAAFG